MNSCCLTIGIPTYNRANDLRCALDSVLVQIDDCSRGLVEILISDNASTDETATVLREYEARHPLLVVCRRNPENLGFSRNVDAVIRQARGEYVLLLGDDDGLEPHAIHEIFRIIHKHPGVGVVFLSETSYDSDLIAPLKPQEKCGLICEGVFFQQGLDYVRRALIFPPFLVSGYVIRRDAWLKMDATVFFGTVWVHVLTVLQIFQTHSAYVSRNPTIRYRIENRGGNRWNDELFPFTFDLGLLLGCRIIKSSYPKELYRCLHKQVMRSVANHIMEQKVAQLPIKSVLLRSRLNELADRRDSLFWVNMLLLLVPAFLIPLPFQIAKSFRMVMRRKQQKGFKGE